MESRSVSDVSESSWEKALVIPRFRASSSSSSSSLLLEDNTRWSVRRLVGRRRDVRDVDGDIKAVPYEEGRIDGDRERWRWKWIDGGDGNDVDEDGNEAVVVAIIGEDSTIMYVITVFG